MTALTVAIVLLMAIGVPLLLSPLAAQLRAFIGQFRGNQ